MDRARILVVDDKENIRRLFTRLLDGLYDVTTAADGTSAISLIAVEEFDVIVTDVRMPGAGGLEVLRAAKSHAPDTEVIVITAYGSAKDAADAIQRGAYDYVQKPFDPWDVSRVIARALERKRLRPPALPAS